MAQYLSLLQQSHVTLSDEFCRAFLSAYAPPAPVEADLLITPSCDPIGHTEDDEPIYSSDQIEFFDHYGLDRSLCHTVVQTEEHAHPICTADPSLYHHMTKTRIHRYNRLYHFRWTLEHVFGLNGSQIRERHLRVVRLALSRKGVDPVSNTNIYEFVHEVFKSKGWNRLYICIPYVIAKIGGPIWTLPAPSVYFAIENEFALLHNTFNRHKSILGRRRFPKLLFVILALLDIYKVRLPYHIPWTKTNLHMDELARLFNRLHELSDRDQFRFPSN